MATMLYGFSMVEKRGSGEPCWGLLKDSRTLDFAEGRDIKSEGGKLSPAGATCLLSVEGQSAIDITVGPARGAWAYSARIRRGARSVYKDTTPFGGEIAGWVGTNGAGVWLPEACQTDHREDELPVKLVVSSDTPSIRGRAAMRDLTVDILSNLGDRFNCASEISQSVKGELPREPLSRPTMTDKVCGLKGLSLRRLDPDTEMSETVSADGYESWACLLTITSNGDSSESVYFIAARNNQLVADAKRLDSSSRNEYLRVIKCSSGEIMLSMDYPGVAPVNADVYENAEATVGSPKNVFEAFVESVQVELDCSPNDS
ncbi:hypothetical protein [Streptomyces alkaliterrae]|uniref:Uncharacterized protein n=1 Tax=Streptomyces alkaliterrae TaxID=2213162 RepID=A0A5P0YTD6_9ACTN|nr:hypothetical protein [Streptomyces alkaliterrae]MQS03574.1 hypothetical protein [Streptomyces alkaliterrae]